jgi:hypothetical protein
VSIYVKSTTGEWTAVQNFDFLVVWPGIFAGNKVKRRAQMARLYYPLSRSLMSMDILFMQKGLCIFRLCETPPFESSGVRAQTVRC